MKFTLGWLKEHLETEATLEELVNRLTMIGLEVEEVIDRSEHLEPFIVGHVIDVVPHPNADRLKLCVVDTGSEKFEVVCGAPNARVGIKGVFAPIGTYMPGAGFTLEKRAIRGVTGHGMLCSERELGLSENHDEIIELGETAKAGDSLVQILGLDDAIIDIAVTPNRGDCLGVLGIARDLAAADMGRQVTQDIETAAGKFRCPTDVYLNFDEESADACPFFVGRSIKGVVNGESPSWLQQRLLAIGLRPISALVDITNFITVDRARPLHVFDADKLKGNVHVRLAKSGETLDALNDRKYALDGGMTVVCDDSGPVALGGVIGGVTTACGNETTNVFIESALFDPIRTATTGRKLNIESDARYRFERGIDRAGASYGMEFATKLIQDICGGEASDIISVGREPLDQSEIRFRPERVKELGGLDVSPSDCGQILDGLGFESDWANSVWKVQRPSWRNDIDGEADLVEEILRIKGYDAIPAASMLQSGSSTPALNTSQRWVRQTRRMLASRGLNECVTWSFISEDHAKMFGGGSAALKLDNPITEELSDMRPSLLPNLLDAGIRNAQRGFSDLGFYEVGPQYQTDAADGQQTVATGLRTGQFTPRDWIAKARAVDVFDAKADAISVLSGLRVPAGRICVTSDAPDWYHPGRSGTLRLGPKNVLGYFGEIHPLVLSKFSLAGPVVAFEVLLNNIPLTKGKTTRTRPALKNSDFPNVARDFAFVVPDEVTTEALLGAVTSLSGKDKTKTIFSEIRLFDIYVGNGVAEGMKSMAFGVTMQPVDATLTEDDIQRISESIISRVTKATNGQLRG